MRNRFHLSILIILSIVLVGAAHSEEYVREGKIGLYVDVDHAGWCVDGTPVYFFDMYYFVQPDENGVRAIEFMVDYPSNVAAVETVLNQDFVSTTLGTPDAGFAIAYYDCMREWHWPMKQRIIVFNPDPSVIRLDAYPSDNVPGLDEASCVEPYRPIYMLHRHADLYINQCGEAAWPAWLDSSSVDDAYSMTLSFADRVSEAMAEDTADYMVVNRLDSSETLVPASADVLADGKTVQLTMASPFQAGHPYVLEIADDADITKGANVLRTGAGLCPDLDVRAVFPPYGLDNNDARYPFSAVIRNGGGTDAGEFTIELVLKHWIKIDNAMRYRTLRTYERVISGLNAGAMIEEVFCADLSGRGSTYIDVFLSVGYTGPDEDCYLGNNDLFRQIWPDSPLLLSAEDVTGDEGGVVRVGFLKSGYKGDQEDAEFYEIYLRPFGGGTDDCGCDPGLCGEWTLARTAPAEGIYSYGRWVETPCDLTPSTPDCVFDFVVASVKLTEAGDTLRCYSQIRSASSIDNIEPGLPQGLMAVQNGDELFLSWQHNPEEDLSGYRLYRWCLDLGSSYSLIAEPADSFYLDESWSIGSGCRYLLTAVDLSGNESEPLLITPEEMIGTMLEQYAAEYSGGAVRITWKLKEIDPGVVFHIFRSCDGPAFEKISTMVSVEGDLEYVFEDDNAEAGEEYIYRVEYEAGGKLRVLLESETIAIPELPLTLGQNVPNPFNPSTTISFYLPEAADVRLEIFDVSGRRIRSLKNEHLSKGSHKIEWDGRDSNGSQAVSGVYFYRLIAGKEMLSRKMILLR